VFFDGAKLHYFFFVFFKSRIFFINFSTMQIPIKNQKVTFLFFPKRFFFEILL